MSNYFTLYEHKNFKGRSHRVELDSKVDDRLYSLKSTRLHDKMSSIRWRLERGRSVVFFEDSDGDGRTYRIRGSGSDGDTHNNNFKDCASAWRTSRDRTIPAAFAHARTRPTVLEFTRGGQRLPAGGHMQGIAQLSSSEFVISGSSRSEAYFFIVRWPGVARSGVLGQIVRVVRINRDFPGMRHNHASGIQLVGRTLAIGTEGGGDANKSSVVFYDLSDADRPEPLPTRIDRSHDTAGAVGLVARPRDVLLVVGGWHSAHLDFYASNGRPLSSPQCSFRRIKTWDKDQASKTYWVDGNYGSYQGLSLLRNGSSLYMVGFNRNTGGHDWADLFSVHLRRGSSRVLQKIDKKHVFCRSGASFRYGGGLFAPAPTRHITLLAVEANLHTKTTLNCF